tara:strand:+ start:4825 stop:5319 length:495 start_codon:yes stop_codon:yes gene_type:complete
MAETTFTGPIKAGNVLQSDGTGNLAGVGGYNGTANVGYAVMAQSEAVTQATNGVSAGVYTTNIVIPADSQILTITLLVSTVWSGAATTLGIGTTASATALTAAAAVAGGTAGVISANPGTVAGAIANWRDVGTTDIQVEVTSTNTGTGVGVLTVTYIQTNNLTV